MKIDGYAVKWKKKISWKYWNIRNFIVQFVKYRMFVENGYDDIWYMSFSGFFVFTFNGHSWPWMYVVLWKLDRSIRSSGFLCTIEKLKGYMNIFFNWYYLKLFNWKQVKVARVFHTLCDRCESFHTCDYWGWYCTYRDVRQYHEAYVSSIINMNDMCTESNQLLKQTTCAPKTIIY